MIEVTELQKKRAENIIWTCAGRHDFTPVFKAYDSDGNADFYWNCIIGAVRKHYDWPKLEAVFRSFQDLEDSDSYENLLWLGLENAVYLKEVPERPVFASLRKESAENFLRGFACADDNQLYNTLATAHFSKVLGREYSLNGYDEKLLSELEFSPLLSTDEIVEQSRVLFMRWFQINTENKPKKKSFHFPGVKRDRNKGISVYHRFGTGFSNHPQYVYGGSAVGDTDYDRAFRSKLTAEELREFMQTKFGRPLYPGNRAFEIEKSLCTGAHANCHLLFTDGVRVDAAQIQNAFEALSRQREALQIEKNRQYYTDNLAANHAAISKLCSKIMNSVLLHLQPAPVKSNSGHLKPELVWRAAHLNDGSVFCRNEQDNMGDLCVDILLDASTSQKNRQEIVSNQGYIIAESLTRCSIPCRVMSFCSMSGYTVMRIFRDYNAPRDNQKIFEYVSNGCNRDGLAVSAAHYLMNSSPWEHRILIILSDVKPNDVVKIPGKDGDGEFIAYDKEAGVNDTAMAVRRARADGISVICVFTGEDEDLPSAKTVYGRDFVRIRSFDTLADTVGTLIQNQIKIL